MKELWKDIPGFPYRVSNKGRIWSCKKSMIRKTHPKPDGYITVTLYPGGVNRRVHCLVAEAFIGPRPKRMDVNHKDGNKANNCVENLEYLSRSDNHRHAHALGLMKSPFTGRFGEQHHGAKLQERDVLAIRRQFASGVTRRALSDKYGISYYTIWDITNGRSWTHI